MDKKVYLETYGLLYLIVAFFALATVGTVYRIFEINLFIAIPAALVVSIPVTFIVLKILLNKEKKNPYGKLHSEFTHELVNNGYTEKFFELSDKALAAHKNGETFSTVYLSDFVLYTADYYNLTGQYDKALELVAILNERDYMIKEATFIDNGLYSLMYIGCLIESYRGLDDKAKAVDLIERARPILDMDFKHDTLAMSSDVTYYNYYMIIGNYSKAAEYVNKLKTYHSAEADKYFLKYFVEADYDMYLGRKEEALEALRKMESIPGRTDKPVYSFICQKYSEHLGLAEEMAAT